MQDKIDAVEDTPLQFRLASPKPLPTKVKNAITNAAKSGSKSKILNMLVESNPARAGYKAYKGKDEALRAFEKLRNAAPDASIGDFKRLKRDLDEVENYRDEFLKEARRSRTGLTLQQRQQMAVLRKIKGKPTPEKILNAMGDQDSIKFGDLILDKDGLERMRNVDEGAFKNLETYTTYEKRRNTFLKGVAAAVALGQSDVNFMEDPDGSMEAVGNAIVSAFKLDPVNFVEALV